MRGLNMKCDDIWVLFTTYVKTQEQMEMTEKCYNSLVNTKTHFKIFWWDNGSINDLKEYMKPRCDDYILAGSNRGCIGSRQWAFIYMKYKYLISVDNDILFPKGWMEPLLESFKGKETRIGMVSPLISPDKPSITNGEVIIDMIQGGVLVVSKKMINVIGGISAGANVYGISDDTHLAMRADRCNWLTVRNTGINCQHMDQISLTEEEKNIFMNKNKGYAYSDPRDWWRN